VKSHKNLHLQVCALENVMAAARSAMQGKMSGHAAARFHARWETRAGRQKALAASRVKKSGSSRGLRGGSCNINENNLRASNRNNNDPTNENNNVGFRVARPLRVRCLPIGEIMAV
jgi:formylglycine-generating enzyme required for sulfatase activity